MQSNEVKWLPLKSLQPNTGQVPGLPGNPRQWTEGDIKRIARSLKETPELFVARPIIVLPYSTPGAEDCYVILGGNLRSEGARRNKMQTVPCYILPTETPVAKLKEIVIKDNGSFGAWDYDALGNEWSELPLPEWGVPVWDVDHIGDGLSSQGREGAEGYDDFVEKFDKEIPLTTDDCYTPGEVFDIVRDFVDKNILPLKGMKVIRPFYPGGDYKKADYSSGVVIDNPPFSIYAEIVRWYLEHNVPFFLFGPELTLFVHGADVAYIITGASIRYENGALVRTSFVTNLLPTVRIWVEPTLKKAIAAAQKTEPTTTVFDYPAEVVTAATLGKIANGDEDFVIRTDECVQVRNIDAMKDIDKGLFGGGFIISRAAAEKARAAAEKARAVKLTLSPAEQKIVDNLSK